MRKMEFLGEVSGHTDGESGPQALRREALAKVPPAGSRAREACASMCISKGGAAVAETGKPGLRRVLSGHAAGLRFPASLAREARPFW